MRPVRMWIKKEGGAKYISHLDLARCMLRSVRRAQIPVWYTEGFNPHPYITFLAPLSLGIIGEREPMDLRLVGEMTMEEAARKLDEALPTGLSVVEVAEPVLKTRDIASALYEIHLSFTDLDGKGAAQLVREAILSDSMMVTKKTKSSEKQVNLLDYIKKPKVEQGDDEAILTLILPAGSTENVNPSLVAEGISAKTGISCGRQTIIRKELLDKEGNAFR